MTEVTIEELARGLAGALQRITALEERLEIRERMRRRLAEGRDRADARQAELAALRSGWLDGQGRAVDRGTLAVVSELLAIVARQGFALPRMYPTEAGGVHLEWDGGVEIELPPLGALPRFDADSDADTGVDLEGEK